MSLVVKIIISIYLKWTWLDNSYKIVLSAKKKKPVFFHFSVEEKCNYRLFDPEDYAYGFRIVPENTESLTRNTEADKNSTPDSPIEKHSKRLMSLDSLETANCC
jgi:hypothetical protein